MRFTSSNLALADLFGVRREEMLLLLRKLRDAPALPAKSKGCDNNPLGCGVSFSGDIQAPPGRGAVQPALGDPAWAGGWAG